MKKFTKNNQSFICVNCNVSVTPHPSSSRDHCTECLYGLHVDIHPGDRANDCKGILKPMGLEIKSGKTKIIYKCNSCHTLVKNIIAPDDNQELVIILSSRPVYLL